MDLSDFDYNLPPHLIAQTAAEPRDSARLFVYHRKSKTVEHKKVSDLPSVLPQNTHIIVNNSKVRHSRLNTKSGKEILILSHVNGIAECLVRGKEPRIGEVLLFSARPNTIQAPVLEIKRSSTMSTALLRFPSDSILEALCAEQGKIPLPPYIQHQNIPNERYQTVYSDAVGSAAAPTAGLHFTESLLENLQEQATVEAVTLHVGLGTFLPLRHSRVTENTLHTEATYIDQKTASNLESYLHQNHSVLAVGTTSMRTLESHHADGKIQSGWMDTNLFLYPGKKIFVPNQLFTNFHTPKSSLLVLLATFLMHNENREIIFSADEAIATLHSLYEEAIAHEYRFFSLGDAMLIL